MRILLQILVIFVTTTNVLGQCPWNGYRYEFGSNCEYQCRCQQQNQRCDQMTGTCASGCQSGWMGPGCQYANVALGMTVDSNFATSLSYINDGDINTCVTLTGSTATDSFIRVTLDTEMTIREVSVIFKNYTLVGEFSVYAGLSSVRDMTTLCGSKVTDTEPENHLLTVLCNREMTARFITVQFSANIRTTELCEFQIPSAQLMSYKKVTTGSSQEGNNRPEFAVDGNDGLLFESRAEDNPWWYVDLGSERRIEMVEIRNRISFEDRILGFQLYLSNGTNFRSDDLIYSDESTRENVRQVYKIWTNEIIARYVLIFLPGFQRRLNFRDAYVYGGCVDNRCGFNCSKLCYCKENTVQSIKNEAFGTCNGECSRNWQLNNGACDTSICPDGGFGYECKFDCHCDGQCDPWTGRCIDANQTCAGNYYGEICQAYNIIEGSLFTAQGNRTYESANQTVDGNVTSCAPLLSGSGASWTVPLGSVLPVDQILIYVNESTTGFGFEVLTERDNSYLCETIRLGTGDRYLARCRNTLATHVRLRTRSTMQICEVAVINCADGTYGEFCESTCLCANGQPCNKTTGQCPTSFCESGYYGQRCDRECLPGRYGSNCQIQCGRCADGAVCDIFTGLCPMGCQEGWQGGRCDSECRNGTYGADCLMDCGLCLNGEACDKVSGECPNGCGAGFYLKNCTKECEPGQYGYNCNETCGNCLYNQVCDTMDGTCRSGCQLGKQPPLCRTDCEHNTYGLGCRETCGDCRYNLTCNPVNGVCDVGCDPGWIVNSESVCTEPCPDGFYGYNCTYPCREDVCVGELICNKTDGGCLSGCLYAGLEPPLCEDECDDGTYGLNCVQQCGVCRDFQPCNKTDGICLDGCEEGFSGDLCQTNDFAWQLSTTSTILLIFGVVLAVIGILSVLLAIWIIKRGHLSSFFNVKEKSEDSEKVKFSRNGSIVSTKYENLGFQPDLKETIKRCDSAESGCSLSDVVVKSPGTLAVDELWDFVNNPSNKGDIEKQFKDLIVGLSHPCEAARKPHNVRKNRYKEIYPYDHTRVNLSTSDEEGSDYINACFISGYNQPHKYIAAQGPTEEHARDFWRMIWQYNCKKIVMLTRLVENNKVKCCQYWPDDGYKQFGDLNVEFKHIENFADFDIRTFSVSYKNDKREIRQFHYYSWVDKNVPEHPASMVNFWSRVENTEADDTSPLLVHCSAGIGRTGTYIAFDYLVDEARTDGYVDVFQCVQGLRHQRVNMVQNQEQYMFVYESLLDVLLCPCVPIPCDDYQQTYQKLLQPDPITRKSKLEMDFESLQRVGKYESSLKASSFTGSMFETAKSKVNDHKNRVEYIMPSDMHRPWLSTRVTDRNDYINAVFLPSQKDNRYFIATQNPLSDTIVDFWRMVSEYKVNTIVTLDSPTVKSEFYWPEEGELMTFMPYQVSYVTEVDHGSYIERTIKLQNVEESREKPRLIKQFECMFWTDDKTPADTDSILDLIDQLLISQQKSTSLPFIIHCLNGATKSGLFAVTMATITQMKEEKQVCIPQTIKQMRIRRPQIIPNFEQYKFMHDAVVAYMKKHDATNNFFV